MSNERAGVMAKCNDSRISLSSIYASRTVGSLVRLRKRN